MEQSNIPQPAPSDLLALYQQLSAHPEVLRETLRALERSSSTLDPKQLKRHILNGKFSEAENYITSLVNTPINWKEKSQLTIALFELRVQKYKECLERKEDMQALQILRTELSFLNAIGEGKRYRILASLMGYTDIREHKLFTRQTEPCSSMRRGVFDRVMYALRQAPELNGRIKFKEKPPGTQPPTQQFSPPAQPLSFSHPQAFPPQPPFPSLSIVQPIPNIIPQQQLPTVSPQQQQQTQIFAQQANVLSPVSPPLLPSSSSSQQPASPLLPSSIQHQQSQLHQNAFPQSFTQSPVPQTYQNIPQQQNIPLQQNVPLQQQNIPQQNIPLQQQNIPLPNITTTRQSISPQPNMPPQTVPQQHNIPPQNIPPQNISQQNVPHQNPLVRPPPSPLEAEKVKREKLDSDVSLPPAHTPTHAQHDGQNAAQSPHANGTATQPNASATNGGVAHETVQTGPYQISFPLSLKQTLTIREGYPTALEFHPQTPTLLLVGTSTSSLELWDISTASQRTHYKQALGKVNVLKWSPDGTYFAAASENALTFTLYQLTKLGTIEKHREFDGHRGKINCIVFSKPERQCIVTCSDDCTIKIWDFYAGTLLKDHSKNRRPVVSVNVIITGSPAQDLIVGTSLDGVISFVFFDTRDDQLVEGILDDGDWASHTATIQDHFLTCGKDGIIEFDLSEGGKTMKYIDFHRAEGTFPRIHDAGGSFFACQVDGRIHFWQATKQEPVYRLDVGSEVSAFALNSQFNLLISAAKETQEMRIFANQKGEEYIWQQPTSSVILKYSTTMVPEIALPPPTVTTVKPNVTPVPSVHKHAVNYMMCSSEGNTLISISYADVLVSLTSLESHPYSTKKNVSFQRDFQGKKNLIYALCNKKGTVVQLLSNTSMEIQNFEGGKKINAYSTKDYVETTTMAMHPTNNNIVAIASTNNCINVLNIKDRKQTVLERHNKPIQCLVFSEKLLVSVADEHKILFWEATADGSTTYKFKTDITFRGPVPLEAHFDPSNSRFLLFVQNDCLSIYDLNTFEKSARFMDGIANLSHVVSACFSNTGKYIYCAYGNGTIHIFDPQLRVIVILSIEGKPEYVTASQQNETEFFVSTSTGHIYSVSPTDNVGSWTLSS